MTQKYIVFKNIKDGEERGMAIAYGSIKQLMLTQRASLLQQHAAFKQTFKGQKADQVAAVIAWLDQYLDVLQGGIEDIIAKNPEAATFGPEAPSEVVA